MSCLADHDIYISSVPCLSWFQGWQRQAVSSFLFALSQL